MDSNGPSSSDGGAVSVAAPNYSCRAVQVALQHLASIDLIELCNEAKVERCRATRDLRSCGRHVESALNSCGHASLCEECSKRCDLCPICRAKISKEENGASLRPRLFYECMDAGLISKIYDDRFQDKEEEDEHITADVQHLYCLFDVALENNLASLICHYVTDVCMDESAVSSDPVVAFLLDEVVVKDWCKRTFNNIIAELQGIYNLEAKTMKNLLNTLLKRLAYLGGISNVLEVLELSFKDSLSAQLHDLQLLQESILKTKQHMEIMVWCMRHDFLANIRSRHTSVTSWRSHVRELKSAATRRAWPNPINNSEESVRQEGSLFIEDALSNLEVEQGYSQEMGEELKIAYLQKDGISTIFRSKIEGAACYPFESLRAAIDILFLRGSSDMVLAKQAIFLYILYDRHWTIPDEEWTHILEDFAASFGITRYMLLESLIFFLLDDLTEEAIQKACQILPEISGPSTHPKIAQVLLETANPDEALMLLRCSGRDGTSHSVSVSEAVTSVRVRVECGLLTEAFLHQRLLCTKVRENKYGQSDDSKGDERDWKYWTEVLVTEICFLCIRRNMVDRMIELPWNSDEEKHLYRCLLDYAADDLSSAVGSLLVVFYIQRYRYTQAYQVDLILKRVEQEFIAKNSASKEVFSTIRSVSGFRAGLVEKCVALLPEIQRQEVLAGNFPESSDTTIDEVERNTEPDYAAKSVSLLIHSLNDSSVPAWTDLKSVWKPPSFETPNKKSGFFENYHDEFSYIGLTGRLLNSATKGVKHQASSGKPFKFGNKSLHRATPVKKSPFKDANQTPYRAFQSNNLRDGKSDTLSPEGEARRFVDQLDSDSPYFSTLTANPITTPTSNRGLFKYTSDEFQPSVNSKKVHPERDERQCNIPSSDDLMDVSWSNVNKDISPVDVNVNGGSRWRSDETSDEEGGESPQIAFGTTYRPTPMRGVRKSRFA